MRYYRIKRTGAVGYSMWYNSYSDEVCVAWWKPETFRYNHTWLPLCEVEEVTQKEMDDYCAMVAKERHKYLVSKKSVNKNAERDACIFKQRKSGRTFKSIADEFSLTPQRIRDICIKQQELSE